MKRLICALLLLALSACVLTGCGKKEPAEGTASEGGSFDPGVTAVPQEGGHGEEDQSAALQSMPTVEPAIPIGDADGEHYSLDAVLNASEATQEGEAAANPAQPAANAGNPALDPGLYQYSALIDTSLGFTFNYPKQWENVPGVFTVCFREKVEPGDFPARVAITAKKLVHSPEGTVLSDELTSYMKMVYKQYDPKTFQVGVPNTDDLFMGKQAYSNTYLAFSGETEVKGFVIGRAVKRVLYVFHFCASYEDYAKLESVMRYMLNSVQLVEED